MNDDSLSLRITAFDSRDEIIILIEVKVKDFSCLNLLSVKFTACDKIFFTTV